MLELVVNIGYFHIPKSSGLYITKRITLALSLPDVAVHKILEFGEIRRKDLSKLHSIIQSQYLILGQSGYNDTILTSYPYYGGHLSKSDLIKLNRNFRFTNLVDPWRRALSLFNYSLNHSLLPSSNLQDQLENWVLNNFQGSILRQYYGLEVGQNHNFSNVEFEEDFISFFNAIYLCKADDVISRIQKREELGLSELSNGPRVNEAAGMNYFKYMGNATDRLYNVFCQSLQQEIHLIDSLVSVSKPGECKFNTMYTKSEFERLFDYYRGR